MPKEYINGIKQMNGGRQELPAAWLQAMNPGLARQSAAQLAAARHQAESAPQHADAAGEQIEQIEQPTATVREQAQQPAAPAPAKARNKHHAAVQSGARPQATESVAPAYAVAQ
jgi:hypothetical protein